VLCSSDCNHYTYCCAASSLLLFFINLPQTAVDIARLGIPVFIVRAGSSDSLAAMRGQEPTIGTKVCLSICDHVDDDEYDDDGDDHSM